MRLAVSNIAWGPEEDATVAAPLKAAGAEAIEVAPARVFADPATASAEEADAVAARWRAEGLPVASMQALLYGRSDLVLFGDAAQQEAFAGYLGRIAALAGRLGCGPLVFGSPRNRARGERPFADAAREAAPILRVVGEAAASSGTVLCIEANATGYGCDFMTTLEEAAEVVRLVNHPAVRLVADTGNMQMMGEDPEALAAVAPLVHHLHLSEPHLAPVTAGSVFLWECVDLMRRCHYRGSVTIEMRAVEGGAVDAAAEAAAAAVSAIGAARTRHG